MDTSNDHAVSKEQVSMPSVFLEVLGHSIIKNKIVGISPMFNVSSTGTQWLVYKAFHLLFKVYCHGNTIEIKSPEFCRCGLTDEETARQNIEYNDFWEAHRKAKQEVVEMATM